MKHVKLGFFLNTSLTFFKNQQVSWYDFSCYGYYANQSAVNQIQKGQCFGLIRLFDEDLSIKPIQMQKKLLMLTLREPNSFKPNQR